MDSDFEHLRLLSIFHYVVAGLTALFGCFPVFHIVFGLWIALSPESLNDNKGEPPPAMFGWFFAFAGVTAMAAMWTFATLLFVTGRCLTLRKRYMFCLVMAALECCCQPFGTVLGLFTIIVLMRESVKKLFAANAIGGAVV